MTHRQEKDLEGPDIRGNIGRGSDDDTVPIDVQHYLGGMDFPVRKGELVERARLHGAPHEMRRLLEELPDREYSSPVEVSRAIGEME